MKNRFVPDAKMFVNCIDCRFYVKQLSILNDGIKGKCCNPHKYKGNESLLQYTNIVWEKDTSCGYSLPKNINIDEKAYFKKDNGGYRLI